MVRPTASIDAGVSASCGSVSPLPHEHLYCNVRRLVSAPRCNKGGTGGRSAGMAYTRSTDRAQWHSISSIHSLLAASKSNATWPEADRTGPWGHVRRERATRCGIWLGSAAAVGAPMAAFRHVSACRRARHIQTVSTASREHPTVHTRYPDQHAELTRSPDRDDSLTRPRVSSTWAKERSVGGEETPQGRLHRPGATARCHRTGCRTGRVRSIPHGRSDVNSGC